MLNQQVGGDNAATTQAKGVAVNDDDALEREADEQGVRGAARGEYVGAGRGGGAVAGAVVQRARTGKKQVATKVSGYPTMEGEDADPATTSRSPDRCFAVIVKGIIPALDMLGPDALKEDPRDGQSTGFKDVVALTSDGQLVGATSGAAPDAVLDVLRRFCDPDRAQQRARGGQRVHRGRRATPSSADTRSPTTTRPAAWPPSAPRSRSCTPTPC